MTADEEAADASCSEEAVETVLDGGARHSRAMQANLAVSARPTLRRLAIARLVKHGTRIMFAWSSVASVIHAHVQRSAPALADCKRFWVVKSHSWRLLAHMPAQTAPCAC